MTHPDILSHLRRVYSAMTPGPVRVHHTKGKTHREILTNDDPPMCVARFKAYPRKDENGRLLPSLAEPNAIGFRLMLHTQFGALQMIEEIQKLQYENRLLRERLVEANADYLDSQERQEWMRDENS